MKTIANFIKTISLAGLMSIGIVTSANAENAFFHSGQASVNSAQAVGHGFAAVGKTAITIVAVPLIGIGHLGNLSERTGDSLINAANTPLEIGDSYVTAGPSPDQKIVKEGE